MGYNTTIVVLNDALHQIAADNEFNKNLYHAIMGAGFGKQVNVSAGNHVNAATVVETHHANETSIVAVGGNCATVLGMHYNWDHHKEKDQINILKTLADKHGYILTKKRSRK